MNPLWQQILTKYFLQSGLGFAMIGAASARFAALLLVDSAELLIADELCRGDGSQEAWSAARIRAMAGKVSLRLCAWARPGSCC